MFRKPIITDAKYNKIQGTDIIGSVIVHLTELEYLFQ